MSLIIPILKSGLDKRLDDIERIEMQRAYYYYLAMAYSGIVKYDSIFAKLLLELKISDIRKHFSDIDTGTFIRRMNAIPDSYVIDPLNQLNLSREGTQKWYNIQWSSIYYQSDPTVSGGLAYIDTKNPVEFWNWEYGAMMDHNFLLIPRGEWFFDFITGQFVITGKPTTNSGLLFYDPRNPWKFNLDKTKDLNTRDSKIITDGKPINKPDRDTYDPDNDRRDFGDDLNYELDEIDDKLDNTIILDIINNDSNDSNDSNDTINSDIQELSDEERKHLIDRFFNVLLSILRDLLGLKTNGVKNV